VVDEVVEWGVGGGALNFSATERLEAEDLKGSSQDMGGANIFKKVFPEEVALASGSWRLAGS
jgi:hypothetical protein